MITTTFAGMTIGDASPSGAQPRSGPHPGRLTAENWRPWAERDAQHGVSAVVSLPDGSALAAGWRAGRSWLLGFRGGGWQTMPPGNGPDSSLAAIDADSRHDAWAFGGSADHRHETGIHTLVDHWDGSRWVEVRSGGAGHDQEMWFDGGAVTGRDDVWAVGHVSLGETYDSRALIKHWDGSSWTRVHNPLGSHLYNGLWAVLGLGAEDAWALGETTPGDRGLPAILRWDGTHWRDTHPMLPGSVRLNALDAVSPDDIWAVGNVFPDQWMHTFALHWDGRRWVAVKTPDRFPGQNVELLSVSAVAADDVWAVGDIRTDDEHGGPWYMGRTVIEHYDGTRWRIVDSPNPGSSYNGLVSISMRSASDGWAVGLTSSGDDPDSTSPLYLHWDGTSWARVR